MSLHLLLVANWMIFLVYEDNDFRHASIHFFEAIKLSQLPSLHQKRRRIFPKFSAPSFLLLTTINPFRDLFLSSSPCRNSRIRYAFRPGYDRHEQCSIMGPHHHGDVMSYIVPMKALIILLLTAAGGSLGGVAYYYQARATSLNNQVSNLNSNASSLSDQIAALKAEIANLTNQISHLQRINSQLNQTSLQFQSLETQLATANAQLQSLETQLSNEISKVQSLESSFSTQLSALSAQLALDQTEITQLQAQISQLQIQLQQKGSLCLSGQTVTIGELLDLSSALATQGVRAKDGSALAIDDINSFLAAAGCNLKFAASVSDYSLDSSRALSELQAFAAAGVQVVVGPLNSGAIQSILSFANANHIVLISPSSTSVALTIPNDYLFRTAPNDRWQGQADAAMLKAEGATKVVILQRHDSYGDNLANATAVDFGGIVDYAGCISSDSVCVIRYDTSATTFASVIQQLSVEFQALNATSPNRVGID